MPKAKNVVPVRSASTSSLYPGSPSIRTLWRRASAYAHNCFCFLAYGKHQNVPKQKFRRIPDTEKRLLSFFRLRQIGKGAYFVFIFAYVRRFRKKGLYFFFLFSFFTSGTKKARNVCFRLRRKMLRAKNRVLRCAHPASRRLLRKTAILTQMQRPRNSATANWCPGVDHETWQVIYPSSKRGLDVTTYKKANL